MASRRILKDTVTLWNYTGEEKGVAQYQATTLKHCYCITANGAKAGTPGRTETDSAKLYIFDRTTKAFDSDGEPRQYLAYSQWKQEKDKTPYWTLNDGGKDKIQKAGENNAYTVESFSYKKNGSPRMRHFEVEGR